MSKRIVATRTLNPLPFGDLEPHRFEDLVRQLAYDLRAWKSLEAVGRSGSDEGIDIRGVETVRIDEALVGTPGGDADEVEVAVEERLWIFQCKREKTLPPAKVRAAVADSFVSLDHAPHGFVIAVAGDVSKKARDVFRAEMVSRGVEDFAIWSRGELEDMLFQPKNDHLLFAYFDISLQHHRRSMTTALRSEIAKKRQLNALLNSAAGNGRLVLLRDPADDRYPRQPAPSEPPPRWHAYRAVDTKSPGFLVVLVHEHLACVKPDGSGWDAILDDDVAERLADTELRSADAWNRNRDDDRGRGQAYDFWDEYIPQAEQAHLRIYRAVPLDRILAIDPEGDGCYPIPHIFVEFSGPDGPFRPRSISKLVSSGQFRRRIEMDPCDETRIEVFPRPLPMVTDPPPASFDHTCEPAASLSDATVQELATLVAPISPVAQPSSVTPPGESEVERLRAFRSWRDSVARPLFSAFVVRLRAAGHGGRVLCGSAERSPGAGGSFESVELRVHLRVGSPVNPEYRARGHLRISTTGSSRWQMDVAPPVDDAGRGRDSMGQVPCDGIAKEDLEVLALSLLRQLRARGW
jgi:hypothetical protein